MTVNDVTYKIPCTSNAHCTIHRPENINDNYWNYLEPILCLSSVSLSTLDFAGGIGWLGAGGGTDLITSAVVDDTTTLSTEFPAGLFSFVELGGLTVSDLTCWELLFWGIVSLGTATGGVIRFSVSSFKSELCSAVNT